ncbi:Hypothetical predicted protein [Scomber scombrus]|uniref:Poly [ADP-ribose] polymerase n=1 Tax=Scomber scombrus TaxID=13677 RepID=A0AAV1P035_SCOSC
MADAYSYALLVKLEENNIPRLKNKLVKYFQSKKSSGGDCEVDYGQGSRTGLLRFRREEDQKNVLEKGSHQINVDNGVLKMTVHLPTDQGTQQETQSVELNKKQDAATKKEPSADEPAAAAESETVAKGKEDETAEEELQSNSAVLENIPDKLYGEVLEMLVENISKDFDSSSMSKSFTLEAIPAITSAVVTFQSEEENNHFVTKCPQNKMFKNKGLSVRILEPTDQVVVDDIRNFSEDHLCLYFDNAGWDVEKVTINEEDHSALISFKDHRAVQDIMKKKHHIKGVEIKVYPFYKSLGTALYGKDKPSLKLPAAISKPIDGEVRRYLNDSKSAADTVRSDLAKHFCNVNLQQSTVCLSPFPTLLQQKDAEHLIKEWTDVVKSAFAKSVSKFKSLKLQLESEVWEESEDKIRKMLLNEDVVAVPDKASGVLSVAGLVDDVNRLEKTLSEVVNKIVKRVLREKSSVTQEMKVRPSVLHILCEDGLQDKLLQVYPELKISSGKDGQNLIVTGIGQEVLAVQNIVHDQILALKKLNLEMDNFVLGMLKDEDEEELTKALLTSNKINAAFEIASQRVQLLAVSDRDLNDAVDHLRKLVISKHIAVEDVNVLKKPEWQKMILQLENANSELCRKIQIQTKGSQVVVSGNKDTVTRVSSKIDDYLKQNAQVEEVVAVNNTIVEYIKKHHTSWLEQVADKVEVSFQKEAICLSGSRVNVTDCKTSVEDLVSSVNFESLKVSKPGLKKFFKDNEAMYAHSLMTDTGCLVQLVDETKDGQKDNTFKQAETPVYQLQTPDGVEIAVCKADMCSYPVHAVVNDSNKDLDHNGGLSAALLKAAGPQFQDECDNLIKSTGQLKPGDTVITGAGGQLCCKKVIHAVGPDYDPTNPKKAQVQLKTAVKGSLDLAEQHGCVSVALPAISRNQGFPLNLCAITIVKAVKEHYEDKYDDITLKRIHFVNNEDGTVQAMEAAVRQEFGNHGVSSAQQTLTQTVKSPVKQVASDPNCLGQGLTKEGVGITLMTGNIENATTEVIVNTVSEDLALNKGAVSSAILGAAGPKLQKLVQAGNAERRVSKVIVTVGCNLKCKHVFHAIAPDWDNGQGTAEKALSDIFKDCLGKVEDRGLTSISFCAIGTGNLGFPRDLVASLMLDEIIAFSSKKKPKYLKKVMIVLYPKDAETIQAFIDEFKQKFQVTSSSTQSSGPFSKITSSSKMYESQMGAVTIQVVTGDITKEITDVVVNSSNNDFTLKSGVSKAILDAAGQAVEAECQTLGAQPNPGIIITQPGNLKCKKILHLHLGQNDPVRIQKVVKDALLMCVKNSHTSVSFPAIGTGQGSVKARQVADAMLDAVIDVLSQNTSSPLKTVRFVIFQAPMLKEFFNSMHQREATEPKSKGGFWGNLIRSTFKSFFASASADKPKKDGDFVIEALEVDAACFHICGDSQNSVDKAKQWIDDLILKECHAIPIDDNTILSFSDPEYQNIVDIQKNMGVSIRTESKNGQVSMNIEGISKNVLKANIEIQRMLRRARDEEQMKIKEDMAAKVADWQYQQQGSQFQSFDSKNNFLLEEALGKDLLQVKVTVTGQDYTVTMPDGPATDDQGRTLEIKRIDKLKDEDVPEEWDTMPPDALSYAFTIKAGTAEHNEVLNLFQATCKLTVLKIERIQNPALWQSFQIKKRDMEHRNNHEDNEKRLFHGTCESTVPIINEHGFNRSYAGKNAACFGNGTYFAVDAFYSSEDTYSPPNAQEEKCMYLCRVLTGEYTLGEEEMIVPPTKGPVSVEKYDSLVDDMDEPSMFVIFHDSQAYPEYLITFK